MKNIIKSLLLIACVAPLFSSCIEDAETTQVATEEQIQSSDKATEALLWGMAASMNNFDILDREAAFDWGMGSLMHIRDVMTEEYAVVNSSYDWYTSWETNEDMGSSYYYGQYIWNLFWEQILSTNKSISAVNVATANDAQLGSRAVSCAYRAMLYLDMARMYEFLPNDVTKGVVNDSLNIDVTGYTIPIIDENTTEAQSRNNPRVIHEKMDSFILADLDFAEANISKATVSSKSLPGQAAIYGLKARLYMWSAGYAEEILGDQTAANEKYAKAKEYAQKVVSMSKYAPLTKAEWTDTSKGFNDAEVASWIWAVTTMKEDRVVTSGILNWTSWCSNEAEYGYAAAGPMTLVGSGFYNQINDKDFRKLSWKAPKGGDLSGKESYLHKEFFEEVLPEYASLKFRPGSGNYEEYSVGSACSYPLMRVEEMYFIAAEAAAHLNPTDGKKALEDFMKSYRYKDYTCKASDKDGIIDEIFFQKRIELWGEGLSYFDYKRLNKPVKRMYEGSNFSEPAQLNTTTRPAWMNICIVQSEENTNQAVKGWNNPDPSGLY